jgi:peptidoglycan/LPS O-acetylase OafA/YrhL
MERKPQLLPLLGMRFIVVMYVVAFHFAGPLLQGAPSVLIRLFRAGVGMDAFFLLSGFVLTYGYSNADFGLAARQRFWQSRWARIYPNYVLSLVLCAPFVLAHARVGTEPLPLVVTSLAALLLLQSWHPSTVALWNLPSWSLSVEAFLYVIFPWAIVRVRAMRRLLIGAAVVWLTALAAPIVYLVASLEGWLRPEAESSWVMFVRTLPPFFVPAFLLGVLLGLHFERNHHRAGTALGAMVSYAGMAGVCTLLLVSDRIPFLLNNALVLPFFGMVVYGLATGGGPIAWLLSRPALLMLGEASYAIYILQGPIQAWTYTVLHRLVVRIVVLSPRTEAAIELLTIVLVSLVVVRWFERPARRLAMKIFSSRAVPSPAAAPITD